MSTVHMPPIVLIGAEGSGRATTAFILGELGGYGHVMREPKPENIVVIAKPDTDVQHFREHGFRVVYVYASDGDRLVRLRAAGRLLPGAECPGDHGPTELADYGLMNDGTIDHLRGLVADLLTRIQT